MTGGYVKTKNEKKYFPSMKKFLTCTPRYHVVTAVIAPFLEALDLGFASVSSLQKRCYNLHLYTEVRLKNCSSRMGVDG